MSTTKQRTPEDSPALVGQSQGYPATWRHRVPRRVRMAATVGSEMPVFGPGRRFVALAERDYEVYVNSYGAVSAILHDQGGQLLGLRPYEFEVIEWHPDIAATPTPESEE